MKITIDTQTDTYEDIKKVLHILTGIIEKKDSPLHSNFASASSSLSSYSSNGLGSSDNSNTSSMMNMFDDEPKEIPDTPPNFNSFLNLVDQKKDEPKTESNNWKVEYF